MTIPKFPDFLGVVLQSLKDGKEHAIQKGNNSIKDYVIKAFSLTDSDLKELVPSGQQAIYYNRISWSITYLRKAGLIENVSRGVLKITDLGVSELRNIDKINIDYLRGCLVSFNRTLKACKSTARGKPEWRTPG